MVSVNDSHRAEVVRFYANRLLDRRELIIEGRVILTLNDVAKRVVFEYMEDIEILAMRSITHCYPLVGKSLYQLTLKAALEVVDIYYQTLSREYERDRKNAIHVPIFHGEHPFE